MNRWLLLGVVGALLAGAGPAAAQYMFLDVNGDGANSCGSGQDQLQPSTTSVDVWLDTNHNANGSAATCNSGPEPLTINSYEIILRSTGNNIVFGTWTDNMGFTVVLGDSKAGPDFYVGRGSGTIMPAGRYKLGSVGLTLGGGFNLRYISIVGSTEAAPTASTSFGTTCVGNDFDNTYKLAGSPVGLGDWTDVAGTCSADPVARTTWGTIKSMYR